MRIEFDQTPDDLIAGTAAQFRYDPYLSGNYFGQRGAGITVIGFGLLLLGSAAADHLVNPPGPGTAAVVMVGLMLVFFGVRLWPTHARAAQQAKGLVTKALQYPTGRMLLGTRAIELAADGFRASTPFSEAFIRWSAVLVLRADADYLYIGLPGPSMYVVPRQAFETDSRFLAFAKHADERWRANTAVE